jgi:L-threonylcarbamoyladenylate synthase
MAKWLVESANAVGEAAAVLRKGGVIVVPTETVYGLVALWRDAAARERIYRLKRRPAVKRLQMLAASVAMAVRGGMLQDVRLEQLAKAFWPGALTVVAAAQSGDSIGLRIPAHDFVLALLRELDEPLAATSANLSGEPAAVTAAEAIVHLDGEPDLVVDGGTVTCTDGNASTVVSLLEEEPAILREGPISLPQIRLALA